METLDKAEAKIARVSSEKHEQDTDRSATTAVDMSHLTLVPQSPASAVPPVAAPRPLETPVDRALSLAFDGRKHSVADLYGVHPIAARLPLGDTPEADLVPAFRAYLDAAAKLRGKGVPVTIEALKANLD